MTIMKKNDGLQQLRTYREEITAKWERSGLLDGLHWRDSPLEGFWTKIL